MTTHTQKATSVARESTGKDWRLIQAEKRIKYARQDLKYFNKFRGTEYKLMTLKGTIKWLQMAQSVLEGE